MLHVLDASTVQMAQDDERRRLARELHDGVVQSLTTLVADLDHFCCQYALAQMTPEECEDGKDGEQVRDIESTVAAWQTLARTSLLLLRQTLSGLREAIGADFDFVTMVLELLKSLQTAGYTVTFECRDWPAQLPIAYASNLYCVLREAIANICKHAAASTVVVAMFQSEGCLSLCVSDDGIGIPATFTTVGSAHGWHQGLIGLRERVALLGGRVSIERIPKSGTCLHVIIPMPVHALAITNYQAQSYRLEKTVSHEDGLTARERELLILIARGFVVKEIARLLQLSEKTVRNHISSMYHKLAIYDRSQLVIYALKKGLVDLHSL